MKIGVLATHPVQYHVPLYRYLNGIIPGKLHVFFCSSAGYSPLEDRGFGKIIQWDIPLVEGYRYTFLSAGRSDRGPGLHYYPHLWDLFKEQNCNILIIWNLYSTLAFPRYLLGARLRNIPVIYRGDTYMCLNSGVLKKIIKELYLKFSFNFVNHFLAIGTWSYQFYQDIGISDDRITLAPYAIDNKFFMDMYLKFLPQRNLIRSELGISENSVVFSLTGKYHDPKRQLDLIRATSLCNNLPIHILLIGEGEMRSILESEIRRLKLRNVTLTGFINQSQITRYYVASDVATVCSTHNPWITVVNEAMCCRLPLLLTDAIGATADLLREGYNGHMYPMGDIGKLAYCMRKFVQYGHARRQEMGDKSMEIIMGWGMPEMAQGFIKALSLFNKTEEING